MTNGVDGKQDIANTPRRSNKLSHLYFCNNISPELLKNITLWGANFVIKNVFIIMLAGI
jgi:hypothetical protein